MAFPSIDSKHLIAVLDKGYDLRDIAQALKCPYDYLLGLYDKFFRWQDGHRSSHTGCRVSYRYHPVYSTGTGVKDAQFFKPDWLRTNPFIRTARHQ